MAIVYQHIRLDTNKPFYIGIGRKIDRAYNIYGRNKIWKGLIKRINYKVEILYENISWDEACKIEIELIKKYGRLDNKTGILVNMTDGGEGCTGSIISNKKRNISSKTLSKINKLKGKYTKESIVEVIYNWDLCEKITAKSLFNNYGQEIGKSELTIKDLLIKIKKENEIIEKYISEYNSQFESLRTKYRKNKQIVEKQTETPQISILNDNMVNTIKEENKDLKIEFIEIPEMIAQKETYQLILELNLDISNPVIKKLRKDDIFLYSSIEYKKRILLELV